MKASRSVSVHSFSACFWKVGVSMTVRMTKLYGIPVFFTPTQLSTDLVNWMAMNGDGVFCTWRFWVGKRPYRHGYRQNRNQSHGASWMLY
jgi:hypothetical protein